MPGAVRGRRRFKRWFAAFSTGPRNRGPGSRF